MKIIAFFILFTSFAFSQNLHYETVVVDSLEDSIYVDLGLDLAYLPYEYTGGSETRAIALVQHGTWTNDSLKVYAALTENGTYYAVTYDGANLWVISASTDGGSWIALKPVEFAGLRYVMFKLPAPEADDRTLYIGRRRY